MPEITIEQALQIAFGHLHAGRATQAEELYRQILSAAPNQPDALHLLGVVCAGAGRLQEAVDLLRRAVAANPARADIRLNLGNALRQSGKLKDAIDAYRQAMALNRDFPQAITSLFTALMDHGVALLTAMQLDPAIAIFHEAVGLRRDNAKAHYNLATALSDKGFLDEALAAYREAIRLQPDLVDALNNLGNLLEENGRYHEALAAYRQILKFQPDWAEIHWNIALALLRLGDFEQGWAEYEWRWKCKDHNVGGPTFIEPRWDGSPLDDKTILLHSEQGIGDTIQFVRYASLVAKQGARVILGCPSALFRLMQGAAGVDEVVRSKPLPHFDVQCPLMSLPMILGTRVETIPADVSYLKVDQQLAKAWGEKLLAFDPTPSPPYSGERAGVRGDLSSSVNDRTPFDARPLTLPSPPSTGEREVNERTTEQGNSADRRLRVGITWAGGPKYKNDRKRSLHLSQLAPLAQVPGITFYSLQKGPAAAEVENIPPGMQWIDLSDDLHDFADTAALISHLDLVISVDTAVAHLAGAMGKPVWVLLPTNADWRWLLERDDSPWYPTMRLFRQSRRGNWADVIERVVSALKLLPR